MENSSLFSRVDIEKREIQRTQIVLLICLFIYPMWGPIIHANFPDTIDYLWMRLTVSALILVVFGIQFLFKNKLAFWNTCMFALVMIVSFHQTYLYLINQGGMIHAIGLFIAVPIALSVLSDFRHFLISSIMISSLAILLLIFEQPNWHFSPILLSLGLLSFITFSVYFQSQKYQSDQLLMASESQKSSLLQSMAEGVIMQNADGVIVSLNTAAAEILESAPGHLIGKKLNDLWEILQADHSPMPAIQYPPNIALLTGQNIRRVLIGILKPNGRTTWVLMNATPLFERQNMTATAVMTTFSDVTEIRETERRLIEQQASLASASRLTAIGEMAAGIAHEINNPLAIIMGKVHNLKKQVSALDRTEAVVFEQNISKIEDTILRIKKIIQGLRSFARDSSHEPMSEVTMQTLLDDTLALCSEKMSSRGIHLILHTQPSMVKCRPWQISQILVNLLSNAIDALEGQQNGEIEIRTLAIEDKIQIRIYDNGPGIPKEIRNKILDPFFTTKEVGKGTGLGLSISTGIAKAHDGKLFLDEKESLRTCFVLELPIGDDSTPFKKTGHSVA
jgi:PAS domain S-box-containing protein